MSSLHRLLFEQPRFPGPGHNSSPQHTAVRQLSATNKFLKRNTKNKYKKRNKIQNQTKTQPQKSHFKFKTRFLPRLNYFIIVTNGIFHQRSDRFERLFLALAATPTDPLSPQPPFWPVRAKTQQK